MKNGTESSEVGLPIINSSIQPGSDVSEVITLTISDLAKAVERLADMMALSMNTSGSLTWQQALFAIFVVVVGSFSAYRFNYLHWKMVEKREKLSGSRLALSTLISDLESVAINYWLRDYNEEDRLEIQAAEISIKTAIPLISKHTKLILPQLDTKIPSSEKQKFEDFPLEIFDLATGDGFESITKKASKSKALRISKLCLDIKATILSLNSCT